MKPKFDIGQTVMIKSDGEVGEVLSYSASADGFRYTISSREVDLGAKQILEGVKNCTEDELEAVKDPEKEESEK